MRTLRAGFLIATLTALPGCSAVLDFDDECAIDSDCDAIAVGLRCDAGFCIAKDLISPTGPCDRIYGEDPRTAPPGTVLTIGTLLPRSGALGAFGDGMDNGVRLAVSEINQSGGVLGMKLGVVSCDDGTDSAKAEVAARHLIEVGKVSAIVGAGASGVTIESFNRVAKAARVLMISPSATSPAISNLPDDGLLWRTAPSDAVQGRAIAEYVLKRGYKKIGIINRNDAYGNGLAAAIQALLCSSGKFACTSDTIFPFTYSDQPGGTQVDQQRNAVAAMVNKAPEAVILIAYVQDGIDLLNLANGKGFQWILTDGMRDTDLLGVDQNQPGVTDQSILCSLVGTNPASPSGELFDAFAFSYEGQFGAPPATFSANAYDAAYLIALAYAAARGAGVTEINGRSLAEGLTRLAQGSRIALGVSDFGTALTTLSSGRTGTVDVVGVSGPLDFDSSLGEAPSGIEMWRLDVSRGQIKNLGVVYDGQASYDFDVVLQDQPGPPCGATR